MIGSHWAGENNLLPLQTINSDQNEEASAGAATTKSLLSPPDNNSSSMNLSKNSARMKCYFHQKQNCFFDYFDDPVQDVVVNYACDIPFQYNKREGRYTEFIGNPTGIIFVATKRDHEFC